MISHSSLLYSQMRSPVKFVQVANGTLMLISKVGNVLLSLTLSMFFVLFPPSLFNSPLSISKITKHLNCFVTFHSTIVVSGQSYKNDNWP